MQQSNGITISESIPSSNLVQRWASRRSRVPRILQRNIFRFVERENAKVDITPNHVTRYYVDNTLHVSFRSIFPARNTNTTVFQIFRDPTNVNFHYFEQEFEISYKKNTQLPLTVSKISPCFIVLVLTFYSWRLKVGFSVMIHDP